MYTLTSQIKEVIVQGGFEILVMELMIHSEIVAFDSNIINVKKKRETSILSRSPQASICKT